jgi:tetratricopeptide (TPR) repeat protein
VTVPDLVEAGIRAYLAGREDEALAAFQAALLLDPDNVKARWYVDKMGEASRRRRPSAPLEPAEGDGRGPMAEVDLGSPGDPAPPEGSDEPLSPPAAGQPVPVAAWGATPREEPPQARGDHSPPEEDYAPSPWDDGPAVAAPIVLEGSGGLDLAAISDKSDLRPLVPERAGPAEAPRTDVEVWLGAAKELFALGDFSGSLELIEKILQVDPEHGEARDYLRQNEATLISMYESKLGPLSSVPRLAVKPEEILWLNLDHRAGFLLAQIDGTVDYDSLFALSGLPRLDTARILANLIADGVIQS